MDSNKMTPKDLYDRFKNRACKRFPKDARSKELKEAHRIKMEMKEFMRKKAPPTHKLHILSNISKNHENYGETPQETEIRMREKNS